MPYKIISPTGVSVTKSLTEQEVATLKHDGYFQLVSMKPRISISDSVCISCEGWYNLQKATIPATVVVFCLSPYN